MAASVEKIMTRRSDQTATRLGVIGTAGRRSDEPHMSAALQRRMVDTARATLRTVKASSLVSGGAAWADHVAVQLVLEGAIHASDLVLHLPARLVASGFDESFRAGGIANYYHRLFRQKTGVDSLAELRDVVGAGARVTVNSGGFHARNSDVARDSTVLLAFTFGTGEPWRPIVHGDVSAATAGLKDGGTADTWDKCQATTKVHVCLSPTR